MTSRRRTPERAAQELLDEAGITCLPVDVERLAQLKKIDIRYVHAEPNVSGALAQEGDRIVIGVNRDHAMVRQRFTIAHEMGHYMLHMGQQGFLFVDESSVYFRDDTSSLATDPKEVQANRFAAALLLPRDLLIREIAKCRVDLNDEEGIGRIARLCQVSVQALTIRLVNLGLVAGLPPT